MKLPGLVPHDPQSYIWFLHWFLPNELWLHASHEIRRSYEIAQHALLLRWPRVFIRLTCEIFGS